MDLFDHRHHQQQQQQQQQQLGSRVPVGLRSASVGPVGLGGNPQRGAIGSGLAGSSAPTGRDREMYGGMYSGPNSSSTYSTDSLTYSAGNSLGQDLMAGLGGLGVGPHAGGAFTASLFSSHNSASPTSSQHSAQSLLSAQAMGQQQQQQQLHNNKQ
mmetsp:Transcript_118808/g.233354  ORF Transcript_118808/g.233354 Transcript_118808/m.233354 type:complete len:156 (+) Transcript_118808:347-814(+)